jgi:hypothetical protein
MQEAVRHNGVIICRARSVVTLAGIMRPLLIDIGKARLAGRNTDAKAIAMLNLVGSNAVTQLLASPVFDRLREDDREQQSELVSVSRREEPELTEETFGFRPTVMISFEEANDHLNEGHVNMVRAVDWIVKHLHGDLVFLANRDVPAILRRDGHVWLDHKDYFWMPPDLLRLTFPYEWKTLPRF